MGNPCPGSSSLAGILQSNNQENRLFEKLEKRLV